MAYYYHPNVRKEGLRAQSGSELLDLLTGHMGHRVWLRSGSWEQLGEGQCPSACGMSLKQSLVIQPVHMRLSASACTQIRR